MNVLRNDFFQRNNEERQKLSKSSVRAQELKSSVRAFNVDKFISKICYVAKEILLRRAFFYFKMILLKRQADKISM